MAPSWGLDASSTMPQLAGAYLTRGERIIRDRHLLLQRGRPLTACARTSHRRYPSEAKPSAGVTVKFYSSGPLPAEPASAASVAGPALTVQVWPWLTSFCRSAVLPAASFAFCSTTACSKLGAGAS